MEEKKFPVPEDEDNIKQTEVVDSEEEEESLADSVRIVSPGRLVAKRFFRSRLSVIGLVALIVMFLFAFIGPFFSPWGEIEIDKKQPEKVRQTFKNTDYVERVEATELFPNGIIRAMNGEKVGSYTVFYPLYDENAKENYTPTVEVQEKDDEGNITTQTVENPKYHYDEGKFDYVGRVVRADGTEFFFVVSRGANKNIYMANEWGVQMYYTCTEYTWDHKPFNQLGAPSAEHWLGTDEQGMDVFVRLMYGGRISLTLGFVVIFLETFLGIIFGGLAGYFGKWVDQLIMRIVDIFGCVPQFPILLILSAVLDGMDIDQQFRIYYLMIIMTVLGWSGVARVVRGQILFLREQEYMVAAEALGLSVPRKIFRHLLPNILPQLIVQMTLGLGGIILTESTLSYLGIGIPIPYAAWGTMISSAQKPEILQYYPNLWIPAGLLIVCAVLAFNFIGDGLRDAFDPKASK